VPIVLNVPHQGSPRIFAPTWLVIAGVVARTASQLHVRRPRLLSAAAGVFVPAALLSLAFSAWTRVESANFTESASHQIAAAIPDGAVVGVCGIQRAVVQPALRGAFGMLSSTTPGDAPSSGWRGSPGTIGNALPWVKWTA
jgi:hypothetical protein